MLMLADIRDILIINTPGHSTAYQNLLGDGSQWGLSIQYAVQDQPRGLADAFMVGEDFIRDQKVCLILGDNIFFGHGLPERLRAAASLEHGGIIFAYAVKDPSRYGVVEFDQDLNVLSIEEKPEKPRSRYAIPGMFFFDEQVVEFASEIQPSARNELEITDIHKRYLERHQLKVEVLGRGIAWLDAGTHQSLNQAANFIQTVQERQGMMISCPEEIAYRMGFIGRNELQTLAEKMGDNDYSRYLADLAEHDPYYSARAE